MPFLTKLFTKQNHKQQWEQEQKPDWQSLNRSALDKEWPKL